jgi:hypothetical protein
MEHLTHIVQDVSLGIMGCFALRLLVNAFK